jgi:hypothetical protein
VDTSILQLFREILKQAWGGTTFIITSRFRSKLFSSSQDGKVKHVELKGLTVSEALMLMDSQERIRNAMDSTKKRVAVRLCGSPAALWQLDSLLDVQNKGLDEFADDVAFWRQLEKRRQEYVIERAYELLSDEERRLLKMLALRGEVDLQFLESGGYATDSLTRLVNLRLVERGKKD